MASRGPSGLQGSPWLRAALNGLHGQVKACYQQHTERGNLPYEAFRSAVGEPGLRERRTAGCFGELLVGAGVALPRAGPPSASGAASQPPCTDLVLRCVTVLLTTASLHRCIAV